MSQNIRYIYPSSTSPHHSPPSNPQNSNPLLQVFSSKKRNFSHLAPQIQILNPLPKKSKKTLLNPSQYRSQVTPISGSQDQAAKSSTRPSRNGTSGNPKKLAQSFTMHQINSSFDDPQFATRKKNQESGTYNSFFRNGTQTTADPTYRYFSP